MIFLNDQENSFNEGEHVKALAAYIPIDRRHSISQGKALPVYASGTALFADISGFTPLTEALAVDLGAQRGAEELTRHLNNVYDVLISTLHRFGGSVIGFSGDAITCWFCNDNGFRSTACALAMQNAMLRFEAVKIPSGKTISLTIKVALATGSVRRFLVGDPRIQLIDALAGSLMDDLAAAEHFAIKGEVILHPNTLKSIGDFVLIKDYRINESGQQFGIVSGFQKQIAESPWSDLDFNTLLPNQIQQWLIPSVYRRLQSGQGEFLSELRPAVALFSCFSGIDYDRDETAGEKLNDFICQVQGIIDQYKGTLLQLTIGDKGNYLYAAFGAPIAHEDDSERAATASLELIALKSKLDYITDIKIGISQGNMRTGAYGGSMRRTYGVLGEEVNLAARLMQAAEPGQILVSSRIKKTTGDNFVMQKLPDIRVKGKTSSVPVFTLLSQNQSLSALIQEQRYALPMVGREKQVALLEKKLMQALNKQGQIAAITGEAGMGKTRLLTEIIHYAREKRMSVYAGECQSFGTDSSYLVWQSIWRSFFRLDAYRSFDTQIDALSVQLELINPQLLPRLPLLGPVLKIPIPDNELTASFDAELRKTSLEALLIDCLRIRATTTPILMVLEDCHWIDPLSQDLVNLIGQVIVDLPVFLIVAYRPLEIESSQVVHIHKLSHFDEIHLTAFSSQETNKLIHLKLSRLFETQKEIPPEVIEWITFRSEGNPFYTEELINCLWDFKFDFQNISVLEQYELPTSLQSLILCRIDKLTESQKSTLKVASVIGRVFKADMIRAVQPQLGTYPVFIANLEATRKADLTYLTIPEPELTYLFKHVMTQEVIYGSLLYAQKADLHELIGEFIEKSNNGNLEPEIDLLAFHFGRSENKGKQRIYFLKAGEIAQATYANSAAIHYYQRVLPLLSFHDKVRTLVKLGKVMELVGDWKQADSCYRDSINLAEQLNDVKAKAEALSTLGELLRKQGQYSESFSCQEKARQCFEEIDDQAGIASTLQYTGTQAAQQGDLETARIRYEESLLIQKRLGNNPRIGDLLSNLGILACFKSDFDAGKRFYEESLDIRRKVGDNRAIANSLSNLGNLAREQGNYSEARFRLEEAIMLLREVGDRWAIANSLNNLGNVYRTERNFNAARTFYQESLLINRDLGDLWAIAYLLEDFGILALQDRQPVGALRLIASASKLREEINAPRSPAEKTELDNLISASGIDMTAPKYEKVWVEGEALANVQAIEEALLI